MTYPNFSTLNLKDKVYYIEPPDPTHGYPNARVIGLEILHRYQPLQYLDRITLELLKPFKEGVEKEALLLAKEMYGTKTTFRVTVLKRESSTMLMMKPPTVMATTEDELLIWMGLKAPKIIMP